MSKNQLQCHANNIKCKNCHSSSSSTNNKQQAQNCNILSLVSPQNEHYASKFLNNLLNQEEKKYSLAINPQSNEPLDESIHLICSHSAIVTNLNSNQKNFISNLDATNDVSHDDQQCKNSSFIKTPCIIERLGHLYLNSSLADVYFLVKKKAEADECSTDVAANAAADESKNDNDETRKLTSNFEKIPAHKLILSIGSQVFMAMFYGTGSQMQATKEIEIPDVDSDSFKIMLKYLYTDELQIEPDSVMSTLYAAKKYAVGSLEKECVDFLKCNLRADNAFMLLEQALLFDEIQLVDLCLNLIDKNACEAFSSECFLDITLDTLILVLKRDSLGIREFNLLKYLLKWAQNKCLKEGRLPVNRVNISNVLQEAVKYVRFPLMTREEFALAMNDYDSRVLDDQSIIDLFINLTLANEEPNLEVKVRKLSFNDKPRCCLGGKEEIINRFSQVDSRWGYSGTSDRVKFSVNRRIFIVGFGLYGSIYGKCEYSVVIQLIHYDTCTTCAQNSTSFMCDGTNSTFKVLFNEPVEIFSETDYIASATLKGPDSYYGTKGLRKVTHESQTDGKVTFNFQYASGNNNGTSVEDGQIPEIIFIYSPS